MKAVLIDDERDSIETLTTELAEYCPEVEVLASYTDPMDALKRLPQDRPDIVFLDIEMPHLNGFELLDRLNSA